MSLSQPQGRINEHDTQHGESAAQRGHGPARQAPSHQSFTREQDGSQVAPGSRHATNSVLATASRMALNAADLCVDCLEDRIGQYIEGDPKKLALQCLARGGMTALYCCCCGCGNAFGGSTAFGG